MTARWPSLLLALATLAIPNARAAVAQETVSEGAQWEARPSTADFERLGPPAAVRDRVSGKAVLDCALTAAGRLRDCTLKSETPAGAGFGEAALRLTPYYRLARTEEVELEGSRLGFTVRFRYAETPAAAAAAIAPSPFTPSPPSQPAPAAMPSDIADIAAPAGRLMQLGAVPEWHVEYLDLDRLTRQGDTAEAYRLTIYAASRTRPGAPAAYEVTRVRLNCTTGAQRAVGTRLFDASGGTPGWRPAAGAEAVAGSGTVEATIEDIACGLGRPTRVDATGVVEAYTQAQQALGAP